MDGWGIKTKRQEGEGGGEVGGGGKRALIVRRPLAV